MRTPEAKSEVAEKSVATKVTRPRKFICGRKANAIRGGEQKNGTWGKKRLPWSESKLFIMGQSFSRSAAVLMFFILPSESAIHTIPVSFLRPPRSVFQR